ncbi:MAG: mitochondrial fission ELM1 family protein, partial [Planctomycetota bacterium]
LHPGPLSILHNRWLGASLRGIDVSRSSRLEPPWPELVIGAGRRSAPAAQWIREQSAGRARLVQLGRKGGDHADEFDLSVTPAYCHLFPHPRRFETHAPLHSMTDAKLNEAAARCKERIEDAPAPRIAVLVGGDSGQYRIDSDTARRLGEDVARMARDAGGSVLATTSRRTDRAATRAFCEALGEVATWIYRAGDPGENPYPAFLALADVFVVTGDSESMLAEATSRGKPVYVYPLPTRRIFRLERFLLDRVFARATAQPKGLRGTGRPQRGIEYRCARLIERGYIRTTRDLGVMHEDLSRRGVARAFGSGPPREPSAPLREAEAVAARVRALLGIPAPSASADR